MRKLKIILYLHSQFFEDAPNERMVIAGCSVARYRATFGMWRSSVRIWPPRLKKQSEKQSESEVSALLFFFILALILTLEGKQSEKESESVPKAFGIGSAFFLLPIAIGTRSHSHTLIGETERKRPESFRDRSSDFSSHSLCFSIVPKT